MYLHGRNLPRCQELVAQSPDSGGARAPGAHEVGLRCEEVVGERLNRSRIGNSVRLHAADLMPDLGEGRSIFSDPSVDRGKG
eukprot:3494437-Pyramimonas_sp.AAC.1